MTSPKLHAPRGRPSILNLILDLPFEAKRPFSTGGYVEGGIDASITKPAKRIAYAAHSRGIISVERCRRCKTSTHLKFRDCVFLEGFMKGKCTNCHWENNSFVCADGRRGGGVKLDERRRATRSRSALPERKEQLEQNVHEEVDTGGARSVSLKGPLQALEEDAGCEENEEFYAAGAVDGSTVVAREIDRGIFNEQAFPAVAAWVQGEESNSPYVAALRSAMSGLEGQNFADSNDMLSAESGSWGTPMFVVENRERLVSIEKAMVRVQIWMRDTREVFNVTQAMYDAQTNKVKRNERRIRELYNRELSLRDEFVELQAMLVGLERDEYTCKLVEGVSNGGTGSGKLSKLRRQTNRRKKEGGLYSSSNDGFPKVKLLRGVPAMGDSEGLRERAWSE